MKGKCCLNCAYCIFDMRLNYEPVRLANLRIDCHHSQWETLAIAPHGFGPDLATLEELVRQNEYEGSSRVPPRDIRRLFADSKIEDKIPQTNDQTLKLGKHVCDFFLRYDPSTSKLPDRIWQEHQQHMQEAKDRRRFWITTAILIATALAVGLSAFFDLLEWSRTP